MSEPISRDEFNAHMGVLQENDRETRADIKELTGAVRTLVETQTESIAEHRFTRKEIAEAKENQEKFQENITPRVRALEIQNSNNRLRWAFLASVTTIIIGLSTWTYTTFSKPDIDAKQSFENVDKSVQGLNESMLNMVDFMSNINEIMIKNYDSVKAKAIAEENQEVK